jgi:hypothetical protein
MERFLDSVAEKLGGVSDWLQEQGWTADDRAALQRKLLGGLPDREPEPGARRRGRRPGPERSCPSCRKPR